MFYLLAHARRWRYRLTNQGLIGNLHRKRSVLRYEKTTDHAAEGPTDADAVLHYSGERLSPVDAIPH